MQVKPILLVGMVAALLMGLCLAERAPVAQAETPVLTKIHVTDMHCEHCAQEIRRKLYVVPGVKTVKTVLKANVAIVVPQQQRQPSPRAMWEAVESAGFRVVQLEGPSGVHSTKPRR